MQGPRVCVCARMTGLQALLFICVALICDAAACSGMVVGMALRVIERLTA